MSNHLKMAIVEAILHLHSLRWSQQRIANELGIDRRTVQRHLARRRKAPTAAISPAGSEGSTAAPLPGSPAPGDQTTGGDESADGAAEPTAAIPPAGSEALCEPSTAAISPTGSEAAARGPNATRVGRPSECETHREFILAKLDQGLSAQRIWQDLAAERQPWAKVLKGMAGQKQAARRCRRKRETPIIL